VTRRRDLDDRYAGQLGVVGNKVDDRRQTVQRPLGPGLFAIAACLRGGQDSLDRHPVGGEEAVVLVVEVLVEGGARGVGVRHNVGDGGCLVALAAGDANHRLDDRLSSQFAARHPHSLVDNLVHNDTD
jgi:galactokinase